MVYEFHALSGATMYELRNISSSAKYETQAFSGATIYELQAVSGAVRAFSGATVYQFQNLSASTMFALGNLSASNKYELQAVSGAITTFSGSNIYELRNISSSVAAMEGAVGFTAPTRGLATLYIASSSYYTTLGENSGAMPLCNLNGVPLNYMVSTLNTTNDSVKSEIIVPTEQLAGGVVTCSPVVGTSVQITSTSYAGKRGIKVRVDPRCGINAMIAIYNSATANLAVDALGDFVAGQCWTRDDVGMLPVELDDVSKAYVSSNIPSCRVIWEFI
jgi:hypothetical protein